MPYATVNAVPPLVRLQYSVASGTHGGTSTSGSWLTRPVNTEQEDANGLCVLSSNQFTLSAGSYRLRGWGSFVGTTQSKLRLRDVTNGVTLVVSQSEYAAAAPSGIHAHLDGTFTVVGTETLECQYRCSTGRVTDGLGTAATFGEVEIYTNLEFEKVA